MENKWTFSSLDEMWWEYGLFDTKEEAINAAKEVFTDGCMLGQLYKPEGASNYSVKLRDKAFFRGH